MFSAYQNSKAKKNIIPLDPYYRRNSRFHGAIALVGIWILGIIGTLCVIAYIKPTPTQAVSQIHPFRADACLMCHFQRTPAKIKGYEGYKKAHPSPAEKRKTALSDKHLLQDLLATTGANP